MAGFKINIADVKTGKCYKTEVKDAQAAPFMGLNIGEKIEGNKIGIDGYEFSISGGTDFCGFPMRRGILGLRKRITIYKGVGFKGGLKGMRKRKTVCGHKINESISAINLKVLKEGTKKLSDLFGKKEESKGGIPVIWDPNDAASQEILRNSDHIIINYHMVPKWKDFLPKDAYGIVDEGHNLLDEDRLLAGSVKELVQGYEYLAWLTATPMPNRITDVEYAIRVVSRNDDFKIPGSVKNRTQVVRNHLRQYFVLPVASIEGNLQTNDGKKVSKKEHF